MAVPVDGYTVLAVATSSVTFFLRVLHVVFMLATSVLNWQTFVHVRSRFVLRR